MTASPLHFILPANITVNKFLKELNKQLDVQVISQQYTLRRYYDSFDWRLYNSGLICEFNCSQNASYLSLLDRKDGSLIAIDSLEDVPKFTSQFTSELIKKHLESPLEMRALLPLTQLQLNVHHLDVLNKEQKTILRIQIDEYEILNNRISLHPLKGYDKALKKVTAILQKKLELESTNCTALNAALKQLGRKPKDYSSKLNINLKPDTSVDKASKIIFRQLLQAIQVNEAGSISDVDTEFLHDYRVAVRRTRAAITQLKSGLSSPELSDYSSFFAWLGQITGQTRDLDVYLLNYKAYKASIPISLREDISPLYGFIKQKQVFAQKELAKKLNSTSYRKHLSAWEQYANQPIAKKSKKNLSIKKLADQRIWKVYKQIRKEGESIHDSTPAEALHDLRKTCKKLRYLMEFFQSLYPENEIKQLIKSLKDFQSVLGDFQDYETQEISLRQFSEELMDNDVASKTLLAMGVLVQNLDLMKCTARQDFAEQFSRFEQTKNQLSFKKLFAPDAKEKK